jgi:hypothetical protein
MMQSLGFSTVTPFFLANDVIGPLIPQRNMSQGAKKSN